MKESMPKATLYIACIMGKSDGLSSMRHYSSGDHLADMSLAYQRIEVKNVCYKIVEFAQYEKAIQVTFIPKRKRTKYRCIESSKPTLVIIEGWGHPDPPPFREKVDPTTWKPRYDFVSDKWQEEFDEFIIKYLARSSAKILADYRGWDTVEKVSRVHLGTAADRFNQLVFLPEEIPGDLTYPEGAVKRILVNSYERNSKARRMCIENYGTACLVCRLDMGQIYGKVAEGFVHVHHVKLISEMGQEYEVDPVQDLRPVCPNCHAVIHLRNPPFSIGEVKDFLEREG